MNRGTSRSSWGKSTKDGSFGTYCAIKKGDKMYAYLLVSVKHTQERNQRGLWGGSRLKGRGDSLGAPLFPSLFLTQLMPPLVNTDMKSTGMEKKSFKMENTEKK